MGLDSVDIVMGWEASLGVKIANVEAESIRTPRMAIDLLAAKLGVADAPGGACLSQQAFYRLRSAMVEVTGAERSQVRPGTRLRDLAANVKWRFYWSFWGEISRAARFDSLPNPGRFELVTMADWVRWLVTHDARGIKSTKPVWTRREVREAVRAVIVDVTGVEDFTDDDDFIYDIGID
jgi:acyl carrier protein